MTIGLVKAQSINTSDYCTGCCDISLSQTSTHFIVNFSDPCMWGTLVEIRPHEQNNTMGPGKMYTINASTGQLSIPKYHGIFGNGFYSFTLNNVIKNGNMFICGCSFSFPD